MRGGYAAGSDESREEIRAARANVRALGSALVPG
jgi:hypothetical protein